MGGHQRPNKIGRCNGKTAAIGSSCRQAQRWLSNFKMLAKICTFVLNESKWLKKGNRMRYLKITVFLVSFIFKKGQLIFRVTVSQCGG